MKRHWIENVFLASCILCIVFPVAIMLLLSFTSGYGFSVSLTSLTFDWILTVLQNDEWGSAVFVSCIVAFTSSIFCLFLGITSALYVYLNNNILSKALYGAQKSMLVMPDILIGVIMLMLFSCANLDLGYLSLILAHITSFSSFAFLVFISRLNEVDISVINAAKDLGAGLYEIIFMILIPSCKKSFLTALTIIMGISIDDVVVSYFTSTAEVRPFTLLLFNTFKYGQQKELIVASSFLVLVVCLISIGAILFGKMYKIKSIFNIAQIKRSKRGRQ